MNIQTVQSYPRTPVISTHNYGVGVGQLVLRISQFNEYQTKRPRNGANQMPFWREFVSEFFYTRATYKYIVWLNDRESRSFLLTTETLPRFYNVIYSSSISSVYYILENPREYSIDSRTYLLYSSETRVEFQYENGCRVVTRGYLRVTFSDELKIVLWEFEAKQHDEFIPSSLFQTNPSSSSSRAISSGQNSSNASYTPGQNGITTPPTTPVPSTAQTTLNAAAAASASVSNGTTPNTPDVKIKIEPDDNTDTKNNINSKSSNGTIDSGISGGGGSNSGGGGGGGGGGNSGNSNNSDDSSSSGNLNFSNQSSATPKKIYVDSLPKSQVNEFGLPPPVMRCFEIAEVINYMKDLIDFAMNQDLSPMASLEKYTSHVCY
eukprot:TRINITY_DN3700_c0_g1_i2.p1 TRINITY_DN3700_c0_g1~~TRINITY_DN3700_c0_g1_i2.p1  ORF type:complete len:377 (-),score=67.13 TRINITY_DN3700_c0_g1_i2:530-1660(-)